MDRDSAVPRPLPVDKALKPRSSAPGESARWMAPMSVRPAQELHGRGAEESMLLNSYFESLSLSSNAHPAIM